MCWIPPRHTLIDAVFPSLIPNHASRSFAGLEPTIERLRQSEYASQEDKDVAMSSG